MLKFTNQVVYKAEVETSDGFNEFSTKFNFGISETEFKSKYNKHTMSFRNRTRENDSKFPKFIWSLTDRNKEFSIKWSILKNLLNQNCAICASLKSY